MGSLELKYEIAAPAAEVWRGFMDFAYVKKWGGSPLVMESWEGGSFSILGGRVSGNNVEIEENRIIIQQWSLENWEHPSLAVISLDKHARLYHAGTEVWITQEHIPDEDLENVEQIWDDLLIAPMKKYLEKKDTLSGSPV